MANITLPAYLKWRDGRPRWEPGPRLRAKGHKGRDLRDDIGQWLGLEAAIAAAEAINRDIDSWRAAGAPRVRPQRPAPSTRCFTALAEEWERSPSFTTLAPRSQRDYRNKLSLFLASFGDVPVHVPDQADLYTWWEHTYRERGHAMANGTIAVARAMLSYAAKKRWRRDNPAKGLGLITLPPRVVVWTPQECAALVAAADRAGLHAVGDASVIALHTAQRLGDVLELEYAQTAGGYAVFRQGKTGARVRVPHTDQLEARLKAIRRRRTRDGVVSLDRIGHVVLRDAGQPGAGDTHTGSSFNGAFRQVRAAIATEHPGAARKHFLDFRDTAITRLALAGATLPEIRAISGHELNTIASVLKHYLALDHRMADAGVEKLKAWMATEGIAV